jgi:hypothetical protein
MKAGSVIDVAAAIVTVALVTAIVSSGNTSNIISSVGNAFSGSIKAALGR